MLQPAMIPANGAIEAAISIAVLVIAFIGWLVQIVGQAKGTQPKAPNGRPAAGQRPARAEGKPQRPRDDRLQSEIDSFLREVSTGKKTREKKGKEEVAVEVIPLSEEAPPPRRLAEQMERFAAPSENTVGKIFQETKPLASADDERRQQQQQQTDRLLSRLRERHFESSPLGSALQKQVEESLAEADSLRAEKLTAERRLAEATAELTSLRAKQGFQGGSGSARGPRSRVGALLRNRRTVKDAIVINEVLGRPVAFRRKTEDRAVS